MCQLLRKLIFYNFIKIMYITTIILCFLFGLVLGNTLNNANPSNNHVLELTDDNWDKILKGQWLIGFFDNESKESQLLEASWKLFSSEAKKQNINFAHISASDNPGLCIRFLVIGYPKVFYIKNGVAHDVLKIDHEILQKMITDKTWEYLKPVNFLNNPFSIQMSLLSKLLIHAVNIYKYEHSIVQKYVSSQNATDIAFVLTFLIFGTTIGLLLTCCCGILNKYFGETRDDIESDKESDIENDDEKENEKQMNISNEDSGNIRKRK